MIYAFRISFSQPLNTYLPVVFSYMFYYEPFFFFLLVCYDRRQCFPFHVFNGAFTLGQRLVKLIQVSIYYSFIGVLMYVLTLPN